MSVHSFPCTIRETRAMVYIGYDVPLQGYFMTVDSIREDNDGFDLLFYSNLDDLRLPLVQNMGLPKDHKLFFDVLTILGISISQEFKLLLESRLDFDRANECDRMLEYSSDGIEIDPQDTI